MKKIIKLLFSIIGIAIFVFAITDEIEGVGRFACILFGTLFSLIGSFMKIDDKN